MALIFEFLSPLITMQPSTTTTRYKTRLDGRKVKLCPGKNNTCTKEVKKGGMCTGCQTGLDKTAFKNRVEGELFTDDRGIRYKYVGKQSRQLCIGDNGTCMSFRMDATGLCDGHQPGSSKKYGTDGLKKGDIVIRNGGIRLFDGGQLKQICSHDGCEIVVTHQGLCKKHSPHWHCKFADEPCTKIRVDQTNYCRLHRDGIQHPREKSRGEVLVARYLGSVGIKYTCNTVVTYKGKNMYPDFQLTDLDAVIEIDGKQHFESVKYWNGEEGLAARVKCDLAKDSWVLETGRTMLRLSYDDLGNIQEYVDTFIEILPDIKNEIISTGFAGYANRGYYLI